MEPVPMLTAAVAANWSDLNARQALADACGEQFGDLRGALEARIAAFVAHCDELKRAYWVEQKFKWAVETHEAQFISHKWCRIVVVENGQARSSYAFVCLHNGYTKALGRVCVGDVHKCDGYKRAAKHARGNVFLPDFGNCADVFGIKYLR